MSSLMRRFFLCAAVLFAAVQVWASPVDVKTAKSHAQSFIIQKLYGGEIEDPEPFALNSIETGDASYRLIEGITPDKFYYVIGLNAGTPYMYRVKSLYVNDTESSWSNIQEVTLLQNDNSRGDVNGDGIVSIKDVTALIDYLLSDDASSIILSSADVNANGIVNIADVTCLIDYLLSGSWPDDPVSPPDEHEWVDLGLPSGTLWATCNVGADSPEEYGDYFAWGETKPKEFYYWNTYKWCNSSNITLSKYCTDSSFGNNGFVDDKTELDPEDDAAYVNWGENWCMPTLIQQDELRMQCTWTWTTLNDVNGWLVTGPNGNSMFLPAAGMRTHSSLGGIGSNGRYWSRTLNSSHPDWVYNLYPTSTNVYQSHHQRCDGFTVRAVRNSHDPVEIQLSETEVNLEVGESKTVDILNGSGSYTIDGGTDCVSSIFNGNQLILTGLAEGTAELTVTDVTTQANASIYISVTDSDTIQFDHEWVDLGLPSGTLWATCNVGADSPEEYGDYFAWGETEPKDYYDWSTYKWCNGSQNTLTKYCNLSSYGDNGFVDNKMELDPEDDAATVNWGSEWRMPTLAQQKELIDNCTSEWTQLNGVYGRLLTGPNENTLFLPAAGYRGEESLYGAGSYACYWPSSLYSSYPYAAYRLYFYWEYLSWSNYSRFYGFTTRAVRASQEPVEIQLSETEVNLEVGESKTVDILNGSGSYTIDGGTDCVSSIFNGNQLILTGLAEGTAELTVTDVTTQANASIYISVTDSDTIQFDHEWVDLGLPSGTLWATCNVGANSPEEYGDYFAWGETEPKEVYDWSTYKWCNGSDSTLTKYCFHSNYGYNGFVDYKMELDVEDDAAYMNWGAIWRMPTIEQQQELFDYCTSEWIQLNGVKGRLFTGSNGNTLFLPAAGVHWDETFSNAGTYGYYWSRTLSGNPSYACYPLFYSGNVFWNISYRYYGFTVRAVRVDQEPLVFQLSETEVSLEVGESKTIDILNGSGSYSVESGAGCVTADFAGDQLILTGIAAGSDNVIVTDAATNATVTLAVTVTAVDSNQPVTETFTVNGVSFTMVTVEGGTFTMGATPEQEGEAFSNELPTHQVTLSSYKIGQTEVTQELWVAVMDNNPSYFPRDISQPVENISWNQCQEFILKLNELTGREFRLPTEAEWEFAARGGVQSRGYKYAGSNTLDEVAWYNGNAGDYGPHPVGTKTPNELGLYDMTGNVWEWCYDWYGNYSSEAQTNPNGPDTGHQRVIRGGYWGANSDCHISFRHKDNPGIYNGTFGMRLAL